MNRALRAATMGVLLLSPVALSACSAGQVTQTAAQQRDETGAQAQVGNITLRAAQLAYPTGGTYESGDDADLMVAIVNGGDKSDTLTAVEGKGFSGADISGGGTSSSATSSSPTSSSPTSSSATSSGGIEIPAGTTVFIGLGDSSVTLTGLQDSLTTGQFLDVTLTFEEAGDVTVPVTVANPKRGSDHGDAFDFNQEGSGGQ